MGFHSIFTIITLIRNIFKHCLTYFFCRIRPECLANLPNLENLILTPDGSCKKSELNSTSFKRLICFLVFGLGFIGILLYRVSGREKLALPLADEVKAFGQENGYGDVVSISSFLLEAMSKSNNYEERLDALISAKNNFIKINLHLFNLVFTRVNYQ
jgi:hypothetical protein